MTDAEEVLKPVSDAKPSKLWWVYEATMGLLALVVLWLLTLPDEGWARAANLTIWAVFVTDYGVRLAVADDRRRFVRSNIPDLIAILPLDFLRVARLARLARLTRLLRAGTVLWRVTKDLRGVLGTNGLGYVVLATAALVVSGGLAAWVVEEQLGSFGDGLWWALVTATTVGYGDISPVTPQGRAVAAVLMLVGIGTLGMITGSIATYFLGHNRAEPTNPQVEWLRDQLAEWDELAPDERRRLAAMLRGLAYDENGGQTPPRQDEQPGPVTERVRESRGDSSKPRRGAGANRGDFADELGDRACVAQVAAQLHRAGAFLARPFRPASSRSHSRHQRPPPVPAPTISLWKRQTGDQRWASGMANRSSWGRASG